MFFTEIRKFNFFLKYLQSKVLYNNWKTSKIIFNFLKNPRENLFWLSTDGVESSKELVYGT